MVKKAIVIYFICFIFSSNTLFASGEWGALNIPKKLYEMLSSSAEGLQARLTENDIYLEGKQVAVKVLVASMGKLREALGIISIV